MYVYTERPVRRRKYGFWRLLLDFILVLATGGLWFLWILIRFFRTH